ncbi:MAG: LD-carboxypeptidase [Phascolarctobacterium sp.]|nr:LD-carboxypeptidase [Phascolarctobacterium sp.]
MEKTFGSLAILFAAGLFSVLPQHAEAVFKGHALKKDYVIAVTAPASSMQGNFKKVIQRIEAEGYQVRFEPTTTKNYGNYSGTSEERAEELNRLFGDDTVDAILCLRGGYGSAQVLDKLDYKVITNNPKMLIGFSDITALHNAIYKKANIVGISAPMISTLKKNSEYSWKQLLDGVKSTEAIGKLALPEGSKLQTLVPGEAKGHLIGGNLTTFVSLIGTPYMPETKGAILILEDVGEASYSIDRMMNHLYQAGILKEVNGIVFGEFVNCPTNKGDFTTDEVIAKYAKLAGKPCVKGLPLGHGVNNTFLPIGVQVNLNANIIGTCLTITESHNKTINPRTLQKMTYNEIGDLTANAKESLWKQAAKEGLEPKLYLHWTAGSYNRAYPSYHINILKNGSVVSLGDLSVPGHHTWRRNTGSIGLSLTCGKGSGRITLGDQPPTAVQIESLAKVIAVITEKLGIPIDKNHVMTHGEAANNEDGYTKAHRPYSWWNDSYGDHDTRGDLEYLGTPESPKYNPWATDGTRGGDVIRKKALAYRTAKEEVSVKQNKKKRR